jgi:hypothetical protein
VSAASRRTSSIWADECLPGLILILNIVHNRLPM